VNFRWPIVDAKGTHVPENTRNDRIVGHALASKDLHGTIDDTPGSFGDDNFGDAGFVSANSSVAVGLVQNPSCMPNAQARRVQIHRVVGQHEADSLVFHQRLAECLALGRVTHRHIMRPACLPEPTHAVSQSGRGQADLRVLEALP